VTPAAEARLDALLCAFQGCIDSPEPAAERTAWFTVDGAAYYAVTPAQRTALMIVASLQATRRIWNLNAVTEDPALPHQVVSLVMRNGLAISCNCLGARAHASRGRPRQFIEIRPLGAEFPVPEALAAWRGWHEQQGVSV
jgi:hypothetical protein